MLFLLLALVAGIIIGVLITSDKSKESENKAFTVSLAQLFVPLLLTISKK